MLSHQRNYSCFCLLQYDPSWRTMDDHVSVSSQLNTEPVYLPKRFQFILAILVVKLFHETELLSSFFWWPFPQCLSCVSWKMNEISSHPSDLCSSSPVSHDERDKASRSLAAFTVFVWGMSQILVPARYYDSKHMTPGSTKIAEHSCAMVNTPCPSLPLPLSMSLSTLPHRDSALPGTGARRGTGGRSLHVLLEVWCLQGHIPLQKCEKWRR